MKPRYYLLIVREDVEPELKGPFPGMAMRDTYALRYRRTRDLEASDGLYPLDVDVQGNVSVHSYSNAFFEG